MRKPSMKEERRNVRKRSRVTRRYRKGMIIISFECRHQSRMCLSTLDKRQHMIDVSSQ